jgi:hypothetical protein
MDPEVAKEHNQVKFMNEECTSHIFLKEAKVADPRCPSTISEKDLPQLPAALEMVN